MQQKPDSLNDVMKYFHLFWERKWWVILPATFCFVLAVLFSLTMEDQFRSRTVILVTPQKVPESFVPSTVTTDVQDRLNTIRQQILSRTRLEQIIGEFGLFREALAEGVPLEVLVGNMRQKQIAVDVQRGRGTQAFEVSYTASDPRVAMQVTNKLASLFIEENLKVREQQAMGTSQFLADEIELARAKIRERETAISAFRRQHLDELPERTASNQARLSQLQRQLEMNGANVNAAEDRKVLLQQQIAEIEGRVQDELRARRLAAEQQATLARAGAEAVRATPGPTASPLDRELASARGQLAELKLSFTDRHPDVVRLAARVQQLEAEVSAGQAVVPVPGAAPEGSGDPGGPAAAEPSAEIQYPQIYHQMITDVRGLDLQIARATEENREVRMQIERYQARLVATPVREMELRQLSEDFAGMQVQLARLVENKLGADLAENLERKQKGEQFKILDPASFPERPVAPNRLRIVAAGLLGGGGLGCGVILLLDFLVMGVRSREELAGVLGVPVLGVISDIVTPADKRRRRLWQAGLSSAVALCIALAVGVVHVQVMPIPEASALLVERMKNTHWTTMK